MMYFPRVSMPYFVPLDFHLQEARDIKRGKDWSKILVFWDRKIIKLTKPNNLVPFTSCTPMSLCTAEHSSACSFPTYAHILYTDFTVHRITHLCPCCPCVSTHSMICVECGVWWWLNYITTGWPYPILYLYICWMDGGDINHAWFVDFCDILTGGCLVCELQTDA